MLAEVVMDVTCTVYMHAGCYQQVSLMTFLVYTDAEVVNPVSAAVSSPS